MEFNLLTCPKCSASDGVILHGHSSVALNKYGEFEYVLQGGANYKAHDKTVCRNCYYTGHYQDFANYEGPME